MSSRYGALTARLVRVIAIMLVVYAGLIAFTVFQFRSAPTGFIPQQDLGYLITIIQLPPGASLARTDEVARKVTKIVLDTPGIAHAVPIVGLGRRDLHQRAERRRRVHAARCRSRSAPRRGRAPTR